MTKKISLCLISMLVVLGGFHYIYFVELIYCLTIILVIQSEGNIHEQPLEEFYQTADTIYPTHLPKYTGSSTVRNRIKSAPAQRTKTARPFKTPLITEKGSKKEKMGSSRGHRTPGGKVSQMSG